MTRLIAIVFTICIAAAVRADETTVDAPDAGFRLVIPDVGWAHHVERGADGVTGVAVGPAALTGLVQLSIQVSIVYESSIEASRRSVDGVRAIATGGEFSDVEDAELTVAGITAPGIRLVQAAMGQEFKVQIAFMRDRGIEYRIQFHAPRDSFDEQWAIASQVLDGFELIELDAAAAGRVHLRSLAGRCGSQVDWADDWSEAAERARAGSRLVVVSILAYPGFSLGDPLDEGVFMDESIVALMEHRFVGWKWSAGMDAPFVAQDVFGLSGSTFGAGLLVCTPDGNVVRQIYLLDPELVADGLREALAEHGGAAPAAPDGTVAQRAAFLIDSGQLDAAAQVLGALDADADADVALQHARLAIARRDGAAAMAAVEVGLRDEPNAPLLIAKATTLIGLGKNAESRAALDRIATVGEVSARDAARVAMYLGLLDFADDEIEDARARWTTLTDLYPDDPMAWAAAAALIGPTLEMGIAPDLRWTGDEARRMATIPEPSNDTEVRVSDALGAAADWLVDNQRPDGGWDSPMAVRDAHPTPDPITMAAQAICTSALARSSVRINHPAKERSYRASAQRALDRYLADRTIGRNDPRPSAFMDYTCWGSSYGLTSMIALLDPTLDLQLTESQIEGINAEIDHLVADLAAIQQRNGGWSYYLSGTVDGPAAIIAMSFTTATVLLALDTARVHGFDVSDDVIDRGFQCLQSMRGTNGNFEYSRAGVAAFEAGEVAPQGSAARGPVCTYALIRAGVLDEAAMVPAVSTYIDHLGGFGVQARKALMHAGPAAQGSHYLLYDYSTAASAILATRSEVLDEATRRLAHEAITREMAKCRNADGSFIDNPIIGSAAGTGLALWAMLDLHADGAD